MRFDVYIYLRYKHKLRIDVITYIPTLANGPPSAAVCLLPLLSYRRPQQYRVRRSTSLWWWIPGLDLWDGIPAAVVSSRRVTAALGRPEKFPRKVPGADPKNPQMIPVYPGGPAGVIKNFKNVVLAHY